LLLGEGQSTFAQWAGPIGWAFAWWGTVLYWIAGVMYIVQARRVARDHAAAAS
jgi:cardiolipin synthase